MGLNLNRDERATNLVSRLFAYAPRVGREALEDYCTEALAWCLLSSRHFLIRFVKLTGVSDLTGWNGTADVQTQVRFVGTPVNPSTDPDSGRFDLVIESRVPTPFVIVVESKVESGFGKRQLEMYRERLNVADAFPGVPKESRYLVTLTTNRQASQLTKLSMIWADVYRALRETPHPSSPVVKELFRQFTAFLKEKGLSMLELEKVDGELLGQWSRMRRLQNQLVRILNRLRTKKEVELFVGRRQVKHTDEDWIGVPGNNGFWAGFGILSGSKGISELFMWVEITVPKDRREWIAKRKLNTNPAFAAAKEYLKRFGDKDSVNCGHLQNGNSRFVFAKPVDKRLNGNGEKVFAELYELSKLAIGLAKG